MIANTSRNDFRSSQTPILRRYWNIRMESRLLLFVEWAVCPIAQRCRLNASRS